MRIVMIGAGPMTVITAGMLIQRGHEVVIVEIDREIVDRLSDELDCAFVVGDGSRPALLREIGVGEKDFLFCLTNDDHTNILAALVGRSLGAERIVPKVEDQELELLCKELGLNDVIVPDRTTGQALADLVSRGLGVAPSSVIKHHARFFSFTYREDEPRPIDELELPKQSRIVCIYRDQDLLLPNGETEIRKDDEIVVIAHADRLKALSERWGTGQRQDRLS